MKKILLIDGHPAGGGVCDTLATAYEEGARAAGHELRRIRLRDLHFDPILHLGYGGEQALETDLAGAREAIAWAEHLVIVYPTWWGGMPALLKGFVERVFLPGFAFRYRKDSPLWDRLLKGRSARLIVTMDAPVLYDRLVNGRPGIRQLRKTILAFCGIAPIAVTAFGRARAADEATRTGWAKRVRRLAARD